MTNTARSIALETLMSVLQNKSYSNLSLNNNLRQAKLSVTDQNLATNLVYGTIQYKIYLEYQLKGLVKTKLTEKYLEPLLLMSIYQIQFLDKIPTRAVLDEANKLAKKFGKHHSAGYRIVNGILRAFVRRGEILPNKNDEVEYLSVKESFPKWLVEYFIKNWGLKKTEKMLISLNQPAKNSVRLALKDQKQTFFQLKKFWCFLFHM